jgi:D-lactate dehydrogenase
MLNVVRQFSHPMSQMSSYEKLFEALRKTIPEECLIRDDLRLFACSTDASFYRLVPKLIVQVSSEVEVVAVIRACSELGLPFTFRAAGTSLSGQAVSDSVLIQMHRLWNGVEVSPDGLKIRCAPAVLGGDANRALASLRRKIGPDPASVDSAMIGGIAANNASGMCCGNVQDTYHTIASARIVFANGAVLDTGSEENRRRFLSEQQALVDGIDALAKRVKRDPVLAERIRRKYRIKNTTGYSLHALVDFDEPIDVIEHLLIGSEGTLGLFSEITYNTVPDHPFRATALVLFPNIHAACEASNRLRATPVAAVELMDRHSLRSVEMKPGIPEAIRMLPREACALLVEVRAETETDLGQQVEEVICAFGNCALLEFPVFTQDRAQTKRLWDIRKGLFPSLGYSRPSGTTIIIEDVAFPLESLADAAVDLRELLGGYGYVDAVIFGHALQGNLHFVFCVNFQVESEVRNYAAFLDDVVALVAAKHSGSLKAEHGTGRNMAPFVESEWGAEAFAVMREIKRIFDPKGLLNPGVILSDDPQVHISNLKATPPSHPLIEKCTECGFCERTCPSKHLTLTPRQRIAGWREISRLSVEGADSTRAKKMRELYDYAGDQTCAVDGLCGGLCPLGINTGSFIKELRGIQHSKFSKLLADTAEEHFAGALSIARLILGGANLARTLVGEQRMTGITRSLRRVLGTSIPEWNPWIPKVASTPKSLACVGYRDRVVYFPSCVSRLFGSACQSPYKVSQQACLEGILEKAQYSASHPDNVNDLCCGMAFSSKGFLRQGDAKLQQLIGALQRATNDGQYPVLVDTSPCAQRLKAKFPNFAVYDVAGFLSKFVVPRVELKKARRCVALQVPCSVRNTPEQEELLELTRMCAEDVFVPDSVSCCGFAGDRGFSHPELIASALVTLKREMPKHCKVGYSTSRTCEIGVSLHSGISYQSIAYLFDESIEDGT